MDHKSEGGSQDCAEAMKWYRLAADQGDRTGQYNLGYHYYQGQGVPQHYAKALSFYRLAAAQGHTLAQYNLGRMYYLGEGLSKDVVEAYAWFSVSAAGSYADAVRNRDIVVEQLTPDQISQAQERAAELFEKYGSE